MPQQNSPRQPDRTFSIVPLAAYWALITTRNLSQLLGLGSLYTWPLRAALPMLPPTQYPGGISVSDQVRRTTVAPWSFRKPARKPVQKSGTRALRFVASACIPAGKLQRKRKHVSARTSCSSILQDRDRCGTARHYRQAKYDSQNPFTIASRDTSVNQTGTKSRTVVVQPTTANHNSSQLRGFEKPSRKTADAKRRRQKTSDKVTCRNCRQPLH
jgi:hypothetical protein